MEKRPQFAINLRETFPHLSHAPIVEAIIDIKAIAKVEWNENAMKEHLKPLQPEYPKMEQQLASNFKLTIGTEKQPQGFIRNLGCTGLRIWSEDIKNVAEFKQDGFAFSRLRPYENWKKFSKEAFRLWKYYMDFAKPLTIQQASVRFINRIDIPGQGKFGDFLLRPPSTPVGLPIPSTGFLYQDIFAVPETSYVIAIIRTIQPPVPGKGQNAGLIIDITVASNSSFDYNLEHLEKRIIEMQWLKNKAFFGSITKKEVEQLK